jgi:hypothetical protein
MARGETQELQERELEEQELLELQELKAVLSLLRNYP